jgi:signal transduction histidine kinase
MGFYPLVKANGAKMLDKITKSEFGSILSEGLGLGIIVVDRDFRVVFWNLWMQRHSGILADKIRGQNIFERFPEIKDRGKDIYIIDSLEKKRPFLLSPLLHQHLISLKIIKDDRVIQMLQNIKIYPFYEDKESSGCIIVIEDLTEQILHEKEISRLNRILRGIRNVNQLISKVNSEEELFNGSCEILVEDIGYALAWIGLTEKEFFDVKPVAFAGVEPELFDELKAKWDDSEYGLGVTRKVIKTGKVQRIDSIQKESFSKSWQDFIEKTGHQSIFSLPLKVDGRVVGVLNVHSGASVSFYGEEIKLLEEVTGDISFAMMALRERRKRRLAEEELTKHRDYLEEMVKERTAELDKRISEGAHLNKAMLNLLEDLKVSNELLESKTHKLKYANKELESFSYSISHDLRAPLRAIDGFTRILMEDYVARLDDEGKRLGSVIQQSARKMGELIDDLLSFSRMGRAAIQFSDIDMKNMANAVYHEATGADERKRVEFAVNDLPRAVGDPTMMRQVWTNLISNALKFSAHRKPAVISVDCREEENKLTYCIKDNGAGFNMKYKDKLFEVFQRLHNEEKYKGTGVGLALVQRIIHRHGGKIRAEGKVDKGAVFYFSLPRKE